MHGSYLYIILLTTKGYTYFLLLLSWLRSSPFILHSGRHADVAKTLHASSIHFGAAAHLFCSLLFHAGILKVQVRGFQHFQHLHPSPLPSMRYGVSSSSSYFSPVRESRLRSRLQAYCHILILPPEVQYDKHSSQANLNMMPYRLKSPIFLRQTLAFYAILMYNLKVPY